MENAGKILVGLFILYAAAKTAAIIFERFGQPAVIGELLAGIVIGPSALGLVAHSSVNDAIATLGVMILMFAVGLETRLSELKRLWAKSAAIAAIGIFFPFVFAFSFMTWLGAPTVSALFIATACGATSVGITARVLTDLNALRRKESKLILAAAVLDDILVLMILTMVATYAKTHEFHLLDSGLVLIQVVVFLVFAVLIAPKIVCGRFKVIDRLKVKNAGLILAMIIMLGFSALSEYLGMAAIIGAFFAGMVFAESDDQEKILRQINPVFEFLVPFFFVVTGTLVDIKVLLQPSVLGLGIIITVLAIVGKMLSGVAVAGRGKARNVLIIGIGMAPRGEVGLIVASMGIALGAVTQGDLAKVIFMSVATTMVVPPILHLLIKGAKEIPPKEGIPRI